MPASSGDALGVLGPSTHSGSQRPIMSNGRGEPVKSQAEITMTCRVDSGLFRRRALTEASNAIAPLGSIEDFVIREHELVYAEVDRSGLDRKSVPAYTDLTVFATVNGLPVRRQLKFVGQNLNVIGVKPGEDQAVCSVRIAGTITTENNGVHTWVPGDLIGFRMKPDFVGKGSQMQPRVLMVGQPKTKYVPVLFVYKETDVLVLQTQLASMHRNAMQLTKKANETNTWAATDAFNAHYKAMVAVSRTHFADWGYTDYAQPIEVWAHWNSLQMALNAVIALAIIEILNDGNFAVVTAVQRTMREIMTLEEDLFDRIKENMLLENLMNDFTSDITMDALNETKSAEEAFEMWTQIFPEFINHHKRESIQEQTKHIKSHIIGTCGQKVAPPGFPGDILLGYFHD